MLYAPMASADLEIRRDTLDRRVITGKFPYGPGNTAVLSDGGKRGRPRKERFKPHAFRHSVQSPKQDITLLYGHDFNMPLASKLNGTLELQDSALALVFVATLSELVAETTHARDAIALIESGLAAGISPGFRIPPQRTMPNAERVFSEDPAQGRALIREISEAILYEISIVTRPAYDETQVEARNWQLTEPEQPALAMPASWRWR